MTAGRVSCSAWELGAAFQRKDGKQEQGKGFWGFGTLQRLRLVPVSVGCCGIPRPGEAKNSWMQGSNPWAWGSVRMQISVRFNRGCWRNPLFVSTTVCTTSAIHICVYIYVYIFSSSCFLNQKKNPHRNTKFPWNFIPDAFFLCKQLLGREWSLGGGFFGFFPHWFQGEGMRLLQSTVHHFLTHGCDKFSRGNKLLPSFPIKPDTPKSHLPVTHFALHTLHSSLWQKDISKPRCCWHCRVWEQRSSTGSCWNLAGSPSQRRVYKRYIREKIKPLSFHGV